MPQRAATIESLPMAFEVVKQMQADGLEWGEGYRPLGRLASAEIIEGRMAEAVDGWLDGLDGSAVRDRRNGSYSRHLLTELGDIALSVPRNQRFCPTGVLCRYARRAPEIDRAILAGFVLGLSTRKVGEVLLPCSAATVSRVARTLNATVAAFHRRPLDNAYKALMLDGVVLARKTGAGALRRPVLVAPCIRPDGRKEIVDFRLAASESAAEWERFLTGLYRRGLTGEGIETICADGGQGLIAALPTVYPGIPLQRCWAGLLKKLGRCESLVRYLVFDLRELRDVGSQEPRPVGTVHHGLASAAGAGGSCSGARGPCSGPWLAARGSGGGAIAPTMAGRASIRKSRFG